MISYRQLASELTAMGFLTPEAARIACQDPVVEGLLDTEQDDRHVLTMAHDLGAAVLVHTDDVDVDLAEEYRTILQEAATLSHGSVTVTDVRLIDGPEGEQLQFKINNRDVSWSVDHIDPEYLDTLAIATGINDLAPPAADDQRRFYECSKGDDTGAMFYVLATPDQIAALEENLGLSCVSMD